MLRYFLDNLIFFCYWRQSKRALLFIKVIDFNADWIKVTFVLYDCRVNDLWARIRTAVLWWSPHVWVISVLKCPRDSHGQRQPCLQMFDKKSVHYKIILIILHKVLDKLEKEFFLNLLLKTLCINDCYLVTLN